jgi:acetylornithine deacetylase
LVALRAIEWPEDGALGRTHYTIGVMSGGVAHNVVPPRAEAEVTFRTVGDHQVVRHLLRAELGNREAIHELVEVPPVRLETRPGFSTAVFAYTTDIPFLDKWGVPLLLGPGSIHVAHTDNEHVRIAELVHAIDLYERLAGELLVKGV